MTNGLGSWLFLTGISLQCLVWSLSTRDIKLNWCHPHQAHWLYASWWLCVSRVGSFCIIRYKHGYKKISPFNNALWFLRLQDISRARDCKGTLWSTGHKKSPWNLPAMVGNPDVCKRICSFFLQKENSYFLIIFVGHLIPSWISVPGSKCPKHLPIWA